MQKTLKTEYKDDTITVTGAVMWSQVWLTVEAGVDDQEAYVLLSPKQARKVAKALKRAAKKVEESLR